MKLLIEEDAAAVYTWVAEHIAARVRAFCPTPQRRFVLGCACGNTAAPIYAELVRLYRAGQVRAPARSSGPSSSLRLPVRRVARTRTDAPYYLLLTLAAYCSRAFLSCSLLVAAGGWTNGCVLGRRATADLVRECGDGEPGRVCRASPAAPLLEALFHVSDLLLLLLASCGGSCVAGCRCCPYCR